jgi:hypothetical protein
MLDQLGVFGRAPVSASPLIGAEYLPNAPNEMPPMRKLQKSQ